LTRLLTVVGHGLDLQSSAVRPHSRPGGTR
jgi:hypothetical protein